jgi:hypothetical protein
MKELKELNLAKNNIKIIGKWRLSKTLKPDSINRLFYILGDSLNDFKKLENLNLSANIIVSFEVSIMR